jgi:hypothetical protein
MSPMTVVRLRAVHAEEQLSQCRIRGMSVPLLGSRERHERLRGPGRAKALVVGEGHAPVVAVLLGSSEPEKALESIAAPKGRGPLTPSAFPLQTSRC